MGRVSKYKKVKSFDPFSKTNKRRRSKNSSSSNSNDSRWLYHGCGTADDLRQRQKKRSKTATMLKQRKEERRAKRGVGNKRRFGGDENGFFDVAPPEGDDFDLSDLIGSVKKEKRRKIDDGLRGEEDNDGMKKSASLSSSAAAAAGMKMSDSLAEEKRVARLLKINPTTGKDASKSDLDRGRREGESMTAFKNRINEDVRNLLIEDKQRGGKKKQKSEEIKMNPEKKERKKEYLKNKKRKRRGKSKRGESDDDDEDNEYGKEEAADTFVTGERAVAAAAASGGAAAARNTAAALNDQVERPPIFNLLPRGADKLSHKKKTRAQQDDEADRRKKGMNEDQIAAEQNAMEIMRRKVQAQYALVKAQRKKAGDFHL